MERASPNAFHCCLGGMGPAKVRFATFPRMPEFYIANLLVGKYWQEFKKKKLRTEQAKQTHLAGGTGPQACQLAV